MGSRDLLAIAGLMLINGFFVASEFSLVKVRTSQIEQLAAQGKWAARIASRLLDRLDAYISAAQLGITLASLALGRLIEEKVEPAVASSLAALGLPDSELLIYGVALSIVPFLSLLLVTFVHISVGELVPKGVAIRASRTVALWTAPPLLAFYLVFFPVIWLLNKFSDLILRIFGVRGIDPAERIHTEEELRHILAESTAGGHLSRVERVMIENVLELEEKTAKRIMIPRADIVYLSLARTAEDNLRLARNTGHTRFPLCRDDLTTVEGLIHVKDLFRASGANGRTDLRKHQRPVVFVSENLALDKLLTTFQNERVHLAMLIDEFGSIVGMVTMENVLEELVGPIQDEFDKEPLRIVDLGQGAFEVDASLPIDEFSRKFGVDVSETESETVGGFVLERLGRLAKVNDHVDAEVYRLTVLQADPTRIRRVRVEPLDPGKSDH